MAAILHNLASTFDPLLLPRKPPSRRPNPSTIASNFRHGTLSNPSFRRHFHRLPRTLAATGGSGGATRLGFGMGDKGLDYTRCSAVSDGGSGEGGYGGWGDGSSGGGGGGDESHGDGWSFLKWYLMALDKHPVITKSVTSALLTLIGDLICQLLIDHVLKLDVKRTLVFTFLGLVLVGPTLHFWMSYQIGNGQSFLCMLIVICFSIGYLSLSKLVTLPGATGSVLRLLLDQFVFSPIFIGVFLSALVTLEGKPSHVWPKLHQEWFSSVLANWQLWIPFQFLNFQFVPQKFQVLAANFVALAWNVILSFKAHKEVVLK